MSSKTSIGALYNQQTNADGKLVRNVVLHSDGKPKSVDSISAEYNTSVQVFNTEAGDILLSSVQGDDTISISNENAKFDDVVDAEFRDVVSDFLLFTQDVNFSFFIIEGYSDTINGVNLNESIKRREHLAVLLDGTPKRLADQLGNWFERKYEERVYDLDWNEADLLDELNGRTDINLKFSVDDKGESTLSRQAVLAWRVIGGAPIAELYSITDNPQNYIGSPLGGKIELTRVLPLDEDVYRVLILTEDGVEPLDVKLYHVNGVPTNATKFEYVHGVSVARRNKILDLVQQFNVDLDVLDELPAIVVNLNEIHHDRKFNVLAKAIGGEHDVGTYSHTAYFHDGKAGELNFVESKVADYILEAPHVHIYKYTDTNYISGMIFVNTEFLTNDPDETAL